MQRIQFDSKALVCILTLLFALPSAVGYAAATIYVDDDGVNDPGPYDKNISDPLEDGSAPHPFDRVQEGINAAVSGDTVIVYPGTYFENINFAGKDITLTATNPEDPNVVASTIIDGYENGSVVTFGGSETSACILQGFTITNGRRNGEWWERGGGINGSGTRAAIMNCVITGNDSDFGSGAFACNGTISKCTIKRNYADSSGGGLYACSGLIIDCTISNNEAYYGAGGVGFCTAVINNCVISGNKSRGNGAGLRDCDGDISNCIIANNQITTMSTTSRGAGLYDCNGRITNCTICYNKVLSNGYGGGLANCMGSITNCIIWGNTAGNAGTNANLYICSLPTYSCIGQWTGGGTGNITSNPLLSNFKLLPGSPCIDTGTNTPPGGLPATDFEKKPRIGDGDSNGTEVVDIGAYEVFPTGAPYLCVLPGSVNFNAYQEGDNPDSQILTISNQGSLLFDWSVDAADKPAWLIIAPVSGSLDPNETDAVTLSVDTSGVTGGTYSYSFEVSAVGALHSPRIVTVVLQITGPTLNVSKSSVSFSAYEDGANPANQTFTVSNPGGGIVNWTIDTNSKPAWLTVSPVSGSLGQGQSDAVTLSVDITGLSGGSYSYAFQVAAPGALNSPKTVTVNLQVKGPMLNAPGTVVFSAYEGGTDPNNQTMTISNTGGGILNWSITDVNEPTLLLPEWLTISPIDGGPLGHSQSSPVLLSAHVAGLEAGSYSYTFQVSAAEASNSPKNVMVNLQVEGPELGVSENLFRVPVAESGKNPNSQELIISNIGGGLLNWSIMDSGVDPNVPTFQPPRWLSIAPASGVLGHSENETVTLSVDTTGLAKGTYSYSFRVVDPVAANSPQAIIIHLGVGGTYVPTHYATIQGAIDAAVSGDTIIVSPGTYYEIIDFNGKNITLTSTDPDDPNVVATTIIDGGGSGSVVTFSGTENANCNLVGFTVTNGFSNEYTGNYGGGICGEGTHATISHCVISSNTSYFDDYEMHNPGGRGGGLFACYGSIINCIITDNFAVDGGGLYACDGSIINCIITDNRAGDGGGLSQCNGSILNCTIVGNTASFGGGVAYCNASIVNCIIWGNDASNQGDQLYSCTMPSYSCIQEWTGGGEGNISSDPFFADAANGDYHVKSQYGRWTDEQILLDDNDTPADPNDDFLETTPGQWVVDDVTSPCIDTGNPDLDWTAELWPNGGWVNMGAYGGTPEASMSGNPVGSIADLNHDEFVDANDLILFAADWLLNDCLLATDLNRNGHVDFADFAEFAGQWLMWEPLPRYLSAPSRLTAAASYSQVFLNWDDHSSSYWASFNVYRSTTSGSGYSLIASGILLSEYIDLDVTNYTTYYYRVSAVSTNGYESAHSTESLAARPGQLDYQGFEFDYGNWSNVSSGDTDTWYRGYGQTGSTATGPSAGANGSTWYVYMATLRGYAYTAGESAILQGPQLADSGRARALSFYYHMYGADMGTLNVDVYSNGVWTNGVWSRSGQQHTSSEAPYTKATVDLSAFTGTIRVRFRGVAAGGDKGDMAIDEVVIYEQ